MSGTRRALGSVLSAVALLLACPVPSAATEPAATHDAFRLGAAALAQGRYEDAIAELELFADRETPHPDASYDLGQAYVMRVKNGGERAGDLGRAAAAFEEALLLRPKDAEAHHALELVRADLARRRSRIGKGVVLATPSLDRALVGLVGPRSWAYGAIGLGWLLALGLWLRQRRGTAELAGLLLAPVSAVLLACALPVALWADHLDRHRYPAVLVAREAFLSQEDGGSLGGEPVVEGARLELAETRGERALVRYGTREGWVAAAAVRVLRVR